MKNKKSFSENTKCEKCGSTTWMFLIKDKQDKVIRCSDCPEHVSRVMRMLALKYLKISTGENN